MEGLKTRAVPSCVNVKAESDGIAEIENAKWEKIENYLILKVNDSRNRPVDCYLELRPPYCDRGHISLKISGCLGLDWADSFPRYFFSFKEADAHCRAFLKWRLWKKSNFEGWA